MFMWMVDAAACPPHSATVRMNSAASVTPRFAPPTSSGMQMPSHPPLATAAKNSCGNSWLLSLLRQYSSGKSAQIFSRCIDYGLLIGAELVVHRYLL